MRLELEFSSSSFDNRVQAVPKANNVRIAGAKFSYEFPASSLIILRLKNR